MASELLGRQTYLLAPVHGGHVLEDGVHGLQQLAVELREVAHFRLLDNAAGLHVVHRTRRLVTDRRPSRNREPVHIVQVTVTRVPVEVDRPASRITIRIYE